MRRNRLVLASLALLTTAAPVAAATELQTYLAAGQTFENLKAEAAKTGDAPRLSDPRVRDTLAILSNASGTFGSAAFPFEAAAMQSGMCSVPVKAALSYLYFGYVAYAKEQGFSSATKPEELEQASLPLQARNAVRFQDEAYPLLEFSERCAVATLQWMTGFVEKLPPDQMTEVRRNGLRRARTGVMELVAGSMADLRYPGLREENSGPLFKSIAGDLPVLAAALPLEDRARLRGVVEQLGAGAPAAYQPEIAAMMKTLSGAQCEGLCRF